MEEDGGDGLVQVFGLVADQGGVQVQVRQVCEGQEVEVVAGVVEELRDDQAEKCSQDESKSK